MSKPAEKGAHFSSGSTLSSRLKMTLRQHVQECRGGLREIGRTPLSSLMTVAVLAIALALPGVFHIFLKNAQSVYQNWDQATQITLYLKDSTTAKASTDLADSLRNHANIAEVRFIGKEQGLSDFMQWSGFGDALNHLEDNPLPDVLVITPTQSHSTPEKAEALSLELEVHPEVDIAKVDIQWLRRLYAIMNIAEKAVFALGALLSLAVLLIVGNTIRLAIQSKREEIQIIKLVGATDAFIRRPFLYNGIWYGIFAGLLALIMVNGSVYWLSDPVRQLAGHYNSQFELNGLSAIDVLKLLGISTALGFVGSWLSVGRHIREIEPR
ncbi:permease-like cell division protein FtsX [Pleionea sp. CnH1-48]|uniref:permease-like cell division protein FtsX n=1 Tax=Pleionea sp. CnH1-48 TaxID=2954494 RepID=UPI002096D643|nr:permease-like cell division protein FtsX [Pleionea sp. CnH1-48]MCO7226536.1 permease-like cell division protein FtsX [Pleionea sp. CnH1-48]